MMGLPQHKISITVMRENAYIIVKKSYVNRKDLMIFRNEFLVSSCDKKLFKEANNGLILAVELE